MTRQGLRLVAHLTLAIFLIANGPVNLAALACAAPARNPAPDCDTRVSSDQETGCCCEGCCSADEEVGGAGRSCAATSPGSREATPGEPGVAPDCPCPSCPCCPHCPGCPAGCWCCAAKAPCCLTGSPAGVGPVPCLGDCLADLSAVIPSAPAREVFQPPRA